MKMLSFKEMDLGKIITFILNISLYGFNMSGSFIQHKKYSVSRSSKKAMLTSNENSEATSQF